MTDKLVISEQSWHYRLLRRAAGSDMRPKTLCGYFWSVVIAPFVIVADFVGKWTLGLVSRTADRVFGRKVGFWIPMLIGVAVIAFLTYQNPLVMGIAVGVVVAIAFGIIGTVLIFDWWGSRRPDSDPDVTSTWHLMWTAVKSKKRKVCPLIEIKP